MLALEGEKGAIFSPCRRWRYALWRIWDRSQRYAMFVGLNPSTADETQDDPTVRRCIRYAKDWGYGGLVMTNAFAYRATDPREMIAEADPVGPENDRYLAELAKDAGIVVAAWGIHGAHMNREGAVRELIPYAHHLGLTKAGNPKHPLYLRADTQPIAL
jgi:hypothetical protein